jgi:drug/metabolite transporter (DMT)-like permease
VGFAPVSVTPLSWVSLAAVVLFSTVMPYLANSWALARTSASRVAFYVFLQPLLASVLAVLVLGETLSGKTVAAGALILGGLAVSMVRGRLPARPVA